MSPFEAQVIDILTDIRDELRVLREVKYENTLDPVAFDHAELVREIFRLAEQSGDGHALTVSEMLEHAEQAPEFARAVMAATGEPNNGRKIGRLLAKLEGVDLDGFMISRERKTREGIRWLASLASFENA